MTLTKRTGGLGYWTFFCASRLAWLFRHCSVRGHCSVIWGRGFTIVIPPSYANPQLTALFLLECYMRPLALSGVPCLCFRRICPTHSLGHDHHKQSPSEVARAPCFPKFPAFSFSWSQCTHFHSLTTGVSGSAGNCSFFYGFIKFVMIPRLQEKTRKVVWSKIGTWRWLLILPVCGSGGGGDDNFPRWWWWR